MNPTALEVAGTICFVLAVLHTFLAAPLKKVFHLLGEVELVFAFWAVVLILVAIPLAGWEPAVGLVRDRHFGEPLFVLVIMAVTSMRPVVTIAARVIDAAAHLTPLPRSSRFYFTALYLGPLLGSLITEPAAMTVTALLLRDRYMGPEVSSRFKYLTIGTLFVNVSIGGVLTHFAAPPVLMVARTWQWDTAYMFTHFGWKAALACAVNAAIATALGSKDLRKAKPITAAAERRLPGWMPRESVLVALFLAGLVVLGSLQTWWLQPLISGLDRLPLYLGAVALTALVDNAALTYLGSQIPNLADGLKYALVAGAVAGGGLTIIANAPNPAGYAILRERFGKEGISPARLFLGALIPTFVALLALGVG